MIYSLPFCFSSSPCPTGPDRHFRFVLFDSQCELLVYPSCTLFLKSLPTRWSCSKASAGPIFPRRRKTDLQVLHRTTEYCFISTASRLNSLPRSRFPSQFRPLHGSPSRVLTPSKSLALSLNPHGRAVLRRGRRKNLSLSSKPIRPQPALPAQSCLRKVSSRRSSFHSIAS